MNKVNKMTLKRNAVGALLPLLLGGNAFASASSSRRFLPLANSAKLIWQDGTNAERNDTIDSRPFDTFSHSELEKKPASQQAILLNQGQGIATVHSTITSCATDINLQMLDCSVSGDDKVNTAQSRQESVELQQVFYDELTNGAEQFDLDNRYSVAEVVVIDPSIEGVEALLAGLNSEVMVLRLPAEEDGIESLNTLLSSLKDIERLHLVTHGSNGLLNIGNVELSSTNLNGYQAQLATIASAFSKDAAINLYGCSVAADEKGKAFVQELKMALGVESIAASEDLTGPQSLGGDWLLEHVSGDLLANVPFSQQAMQEVNFVLANCSIRNGVIFHPFLADSALSVGKVSTSGGVVSSGSFYVTSANNSNLLPGGGLAGTVSISNLSVAQVEGHSLCTKVTLPAFIAPLDDGSESVNITDDGSNGDSVFDVDGNDGNGGATDANVTYDFSEDNFNPKSDGDSDGNALFAINSSTGVITVNDSDDLVAGESYALSVRIQDGDINKSTVQATVNVSVGSAADTTPPVVDNIDDISTAEDAPFNLSISGTDVNGDALTFRLKTGSPSWLSVAPTPAVIDTIAGNGTNGFSGDGGSALLAELDSPFRLAVDNSDNIYVLDAVNGRIRKIDSSGNISTVVGGGNESPASGVLATSATYGSFAIQGVAVANNGEVYFTERSADRVSKVNAIDGTISILPVSLQDPNDIAIDSNDNLYIANGTSSNVIKVNLSNNAASSFAGTLGSSAHSGDGGLATSAEIKSVFGLAIDKQNNVYISDLIGQRIRKVNASTGIISTVVGTGTSGNDGDGGAPALATINNPYQLATDSAGSLYIADSRNNKIRKANFIEAKMSTFAGIGFGGFAGDGGEPDSARINDPRGVAFDSKGNLYIAERSNHRVRKVTSPGTKIVGTPSNDDVGVHNVCIIANDGTNDSAEECFTLTVTNVNDAPVATAQSISTIENTAQAITLAGTDVDNDDNSLTFSVVGQPSNGQLTGSGSNLTYTPDNNFTGNDSFSFKANDGALDSTNATVSITVTEQPKLTYTGTVRDDVLAASYDNKSYDVSSQESSVFDLAFNGDGTQLYLVGSNSRSVHQYSLSAPYDVSTISYDNKSYSVSSQDSTPIGLIFNGDGSKLYIAGFSTRAIYQYALSTPYDVTTASYDSKSFDISGQESRPRGLSFNADGSKLYIIGDGSKKVHQYSLSSAYDISSASYDDISYETRSASPQGMAFSLDGDRLYTVGTGRVYQSNLSTPYDISSAQYLEEFNVSAQDTMPRGLVLKPDLEKFYVLGGQNDTVYQYSLPFGDLNEAGANAGVGAISGQITISITGDTFVNSSGTLISPTHFTINNLPAGLTATLQISADGKTATLVFSGNATASQLSDSVAYLQFTFTDAAFTGGDASAINNSMNANSGVGINFSNDTTAPTLAVVTPVATPTFDSTPNVTFSSNEAGTLAVAGSCGTSSSNVVTVGNNTITLTDVDNSSPLTAGTYSDCTVTVTDVLGNTSTALSIPSFEVKAPTITYQTAGNGISGASYDNVRFSVKSQDAGPTDLSFNNDGSKLYVVGLNTDSIYQYSLSSVYDISTATYDNVSFSVANEEASANGIAFNTNGSKLYVTGYDSDRIRQYSLVTPYDLNTVSYDNVLFDPTSQESNPRGLAFNPNGSKLYITGSSGSVHQYTLSTPYDLSTASFDNVSLSVYSQEKKPADVEFNSDGSKLYVIGFSSGSVHQYSLSTPYDLSTAQYDNDSLSVKSEEPLPNGILLNQAAGKLYVTGTNNDSVFQYSLPSSGFSETNGGAGSGAVSGALTVDIDGDTFVNASGTLTSPTHFTINNLPAGLTATMDVDSTGKSATLVLTGSTSPSQAIDSITDLQFTFTDAAFSGGDASAINNSINANSGIGITFSDDTLKPVANAQSVSTNEGTAKAVTLSATDANSDDDKLVYSIVSTPLNGQLSGSGANMTYTPTVGFTGNDSFTFKANDGSVDSDAATVSITVTEAPKLSYASSVDVVSSASYDNKSFDIRSIGSGAFFSLVFNNDGTKLYVAGLSDRNVHQLSLSTAYDISTARHDNSYSVSAQLGAATGLTFNNDGSKLYVADTGSRRVYQYSLSTPFDVTTASYDNKNFDISGQEEIPRGLSFNTDGSKFYVIGDSSDKVHQYSLSSAYDVSTASYDDISYSTSTNSPQGMAFSQDGNNLYVVGNGNVYQSSLSTSYDISSAQPISVFSINSQADRPRGIALKPNLEKFYVLGGRSLSIYQYSLPFRDLTEVGGSAGTGAINGQITISLVGDTFANAGGVLTSPTHFTINNLPAGLTATLQISADGKTATLVFSGNATASQLSDSIADLQFTFTDAAFTGGDASAINNSMNANSGVGINFSNDTTAPNLAVVNAVATPTFDSTPNVTFSSNEAGTLAVAGSCGTSSSNVVTVGNNTITLTGTDNSSPLSAGIYSNCTVTVTDVAGNTSNPLALTTFDIQSPKLNYSAQPINISDASYDNVRFSVSAQDGDPSDLHFSDDGRKLYMIGQNSDAIHQYSLSSAYDVSTASYDNVSANFGDWDTSPSGFSFSSNGSKLFVIGSGSNAVHEYLLDTAYDLSDVLFRRSFDVSSEEAAPRGLEFNTDGTQLYVVGNASDVVHQYSLSTPFDLSNVNYTNKTLDFSAQEDRANGIEFNSEGSKLYVIGQNSDSIHQYSLSTPFDISTASYDNESFSVTDETVPFNLTFNNDASKLFIIGIGLDSVFQYSLPSPGFSETNGGAGSGAVSGALRVDIDGDTFVNASGTLTSPAHFTINNLPVGITASMDVICTGDGATLVLTGSTSSSQAIDSITDLQFTFTDAAFSGGDAGAINNSINANSGIGITFSDDTVKPVANAQSVSTNEGTAKAITLSATDANSDDDKLVYSIVSTPLNGQLSGSGANMTYTPTVGFTGNDSFTFKANDGSVDSEPATISIQVNSHPQVSVIDDVELDEGGNLNLVLNGQSANGSPLSWRLADSSPSWLSIDSVAAGEVTTIAGLAGTSGGTDANGTNARFSFPYNGVVDSQNNIYVVDTGNNKIRKIAPSGDVTTFAGSGTQGDANGSGINASFDLPLGIAIDNNDNLYIADAGNHLIRKITPAGEVTTLAGTAGSDGDDDGTGNLAKFNDPNNLVVASDGNIYVTDRGNHTIRKITPAGEVSTFAGDSGSPDSTNGNGSSARFNFPTGITFTADHLYVTEQGSHLIRKISLIGDVTTFAGQVDTMGSEDGNGVNASFSVPTGITADGDNNLYVTDRENQLIRKITPLGDVTTLAGSLGVSGSADGNGTAAQFNRPSGLVADSQNNVYVIDQNNHVIRRISAAKNTLTGTPSRSDAGQYSICVIANDGISDSTEQCFSLTVIPDNTAPVANNQNVTINEDVATNITLTGTDVDVADSLAYLIVSPPTSGQLSGLGANLTYTPNANANGDDSFTFKVNDGTVDSSIATVNITINPINDVPSVDAQSVETVEETPKAITLTGNDVETRVLTFVITSPPSNGQLIGSDANRTYVPNVNFTGQDSFTFTASDGSAISTTATVTINVTNVNDAPVATAQTVTTAEDGSILIELSGTDIDGDALTYEVLTQPTNGVLTGTGANRTYTPNEDTYGGDEFTFRVSDGEQSSSPATITINVASVNDAPVAVNDSLTVAQNSIATVVNVLANDTDVETSNLTVVSASATNGQVVINSDFSLSYTPNQDYVGSDTINYTIRDGDNATDGGEVSVTVTEAVVNAAPVAVADSATVNAGESITVDVLANDTDAENEALSLVSVTTAVGEAEVLNNQIRFSVANNLRGLSVVNYLMRDASGNTAEGVLNVTINNAQGITLTAPADLCDANAVNATGLMTRVNIGEASATDGQGRNLGVSLVGGDTLFAPGRHTVLWQAQDREGNRQTAEQVICVNPQVSLGLDKSVLEGEVARFSVSLNGEAPNYPVTVAYTVAGTADDADHNLQSGEITIDAGTSKTLEFQVEQDNTDEGNETVIISLDANSNAGAISAQTLTITEQNIAPVVRLTAQQDGQMRTTIAIDGGDVVIRSGARDINSADTLSFQWATGQGGNTGVLTNTSVNDDIFSFSPTNLEAGLYTITLTASDNGSPSLNDVDTIMLKVIATLPTLTDTDSDGDGIPDNLEGLGDSDGDGIADYLDGVNGCNIQQEDGGEVVSFLVESPTGTCLRQGQFALQGSTNGLRLTGGDISNIEALPADTEMQNIGGVFDYVVTDLAQAGDVVAIVIPQRNPIPENAVYRKFNAAQNWHNFVENATNSLWSAPGEQGQCPSPNLSPDTSTVNNPWTQGLTAGHWCVQMLIEDGGANDDDNIANGTIVDPGFVGAAQNGNSAPVVTNDTAELVINTSITVDVLANDTDADNNSLTISSAVATIGSVDITNNQLRYTPLANYTGTVVITYGVSDGQGATTQGKLTLTIIGNTPPVVVNEQSQTNQDQAVTTNLLANDSDGENDALTLVAVDNQNVRFSANGQATFTPPADFFGVISINYTVEDSVGNRSQGQWQVTVIQVHQPRVNSTGGGSMGMLMLLTLLLLGARQVNQQYCKCQVLRQSTVMGKE